jgi:hypothetical protein
VEKKLLERQAKRKEAIKKAGIEYDFEGYVSCSMLRRGSWLRSVADRLCPTCVDCMRLAYSVTCPRSSRIISLHTLHALAAALCCACSWAAYDLARLARARLVTRPHLLPERCRAALQLCCTRGVGGH